MNALKAAAIGGETAVLAATATVAYGLVSGTGNTLIWGPVVIAATAVEVCRLPLVMRAPALGTAGRASAIVLALALSAITGETLALGFEGLLNARDLSATAAETHLAEAQTSFDAAKADAARRDQERDQLTAGVAEAQKHSEEIGREAVALQSNPSVSAYRSRRGWAAPGAGAANTAAAANARAQADHAHRAAAAEADLVAARAALAAVPPVDIKAAEANLVAAKQTAEHERSLSPMRRLAAAIYRTSDLKASQYEAVRWVAVLSLAVIVSVGTLAAGLISTLPDRGDKPSKVSRAIRAMIAARRKTVRRLEEKIAYRDRVVVKWIPFDPKAGLRIKPDGEPGEVVHSPAWAKTS